MSKFGLISGQEKVEGLTSRNRFSSVMANHYALHYHFFTHLRAEIQPRRFLKSPRACF